MYLRTTTDPDTLNMMTKASITVKGIQLSYLLQNDAAENTIFFIHGNSISADSWKKQLNSELLSRYRLIALDLPAHGDSDASLHPEEDYSLPGLAAYVAEVVKELAPKQPYILTGLSLGANLAAEALAFGVQPVGLALAGPSIIAPEIPIERIVKSGSNVYVVFTEQASEAEVSTYASQGLLSNNPQDKADFIRDYFGVKLPFRSVLNQSISENRYSDEIDLIRQSGIKTLVAMGADEQVVYPDYLDEVPLDLWGGEVHKIAGASHLVPIDQPEAFNELLAAYAADVFNFKQK